MTQQNDDLLTILQLEESEVSMEDYCGSSYLRWEEKVATPKLRALGYEVMRWRSADSDSFGPLVRAVDVKKDGAKRTLFYG